MNDCMYACVLVCVIRARVRVRAHARTRVSAPQQTFTTNQETLLPHDSPCQYTAALAAAASLAPAPNDEVRGASGERGHFFAPEYRDRRARAHAHQSS